MNRLTVVGIVAASAFVVGGQTSHDPDAVLEQVRTKVRTMTQRIPHYTCVQTIERRYYTHAAAKAPSCDQIAADRKTGHTKLHLYATDRLRLEVAVADGREIVAWPGAGKFDARRLDEIVGEGPTGTGAFGGHLVDVFSNDGAKFEFLSAKSVNGRDLLEYRFIVPLKASNYRIHAQGVDEWHVTGYDGKFLVDPQSSELIRPELRTDQLPPDTGMCESSTILDYQRTHIGDTDFLLPRQSELQIVQTDAKETSNVTTFSSCREYHTESIIRFDEEDAPDSAAKAAQAAASAKPLPDGLSLDMALLTKIDTGTAAAGDVVSARVTRAVKNPKSKETLVPAGAIAHGRIARMRHRIGGPDDYIILIAFDSLEMNGRTTPLSVKLDSVDQLDRARLLVANRPRMRAAFSQGPDTWGALIFPVDAQHFVVPAGYSATWITVPPRAEKQ